MLETRYAGLLTSVSLHLILLAAWMVHLDERANGLPGLSDGFGMSVSLVDSASRPEPAIPPSPQKPIETEVSTHGPPSPPKPAEEDAKLTKSVDEPESQSTSSPESPFTKALAADSAGQGGDPKALGDLMARIAACLPADLHPALMQARLVLDIGDDGALRAAPSIENSGPDLSEADRLTADRLVQAALQCGPYDIRGVKGQIVPLAADFTGLNPSVIAEANSEPGASPKPFSIWGWLEKHP